jgi:hypothetical protein
MHIIDKFLKQSTYEILGVPQVNQKEFAELIVRECSRICGSQIDQRNILKHFNFEVESSVKYPSPKVSGSIDSQYTREYNIPKL